MEAEEDENAEGETAVSDGGAKPTTSPRCDGQNADVHWNRALTFVAEFRRVSAEAADAEGWNAWAQIHVMPIGTAPALPRDQHLRLNGTHRSTLLALRGNGTAARTTHHALRFTHNARFPRPSFSSPVIQGASALDSSARARDDLLNTSLSLCPLCTPWLSKSAQSSSYG